MTYLPISSPTLRASFGRALLSFTLALPLACGESPGDDADTDTGTDTGGEPDSWDELVEPVPGTRLRPMFRVADDGTRIHIGWHDTLLDTPCAFSPTPEAGLRCLPTTAGNDVWLYADSNCSEPALQDIGIPEGATVVRERGDGCFDHSYYEIGEPVTELYYAANGPCEFFSNDPGHRVTVIPHAEFVAATVTPQQGNSRIVPLLLQADDGAQQIFGAWDTVHEEEVSAALDTSDQLRWLGRWSPNVSSNYYADASCTEPVALANCVPPSEQPTTAKDTEKGSCSALLSHHELHEEVEQVYAMTGGGDCEPATIYHARAWRVGAPLDGSDFAVSSIVDGGGERIRHDLFTNPEGEPFLASRRVHDRQLSEVQCYWQDPLTYSDDPSTSANFDCIPVDAPRLISRYQDPSCTQQTAARWVPEEACFDEALYAYDDEGIAVPLAGPVAGEGDFGLDDDEECVALSPSEPPGGGGGEYEYYLAEGAAIEVAHAVDVIE